VDVHKRANTYKATISCMISRLVATSSGVLRVVVGVVVVGDVTRVAEAVLYVESTASMLVVVSMVGIVVVVARGIRR
jgi:hypothetical protein